MSKSFSLDPHGIHVRKIFRNAAPAALYEAALRYELWRLTGDAAHAAAALSHYTTLHDRTPNREFRDRLQQLTGAHPPILPLSKNNQSG